MLNDGVIQKSDFREGTARSVPKVAAIAHSLPLSGSPTPKSTCFLDSIIVITHCI